MQNQRTARPRSGKMAAMEWALLKSYRVAACLALFGVTLEGNRIKPEKRDQVTEGNRPKNHKKAHEEPFA